MKHWCSSEPSQMEYTLLSEALGLQIHLLQEVRSDREVDVGPIIMDLLLGWMPRFVLRDSDEVCDRIECQVCFRPLQEATTAQARPASGFRCTVCSDACQYLPRPSRVVWPGQALFRKAVDTT